MNVPPIKLFISSASSWSRTNLHDLDFIDIVT
jgi:hypothetical protein